jgi:3-phosphoshikimate 1-carboxyvinyltransferase
MNAQKVQAPSSKSVSHRAVLLAALAQGASRLSRVLESEDLERTIDIMSRCGASIRRLDPGEYAVRGVNGRLYGGVEGPLYLDVGESGTTCRLIAALLAAGSGAFLVHGRGRMHDRPIAELGKALTSLGVRCEYPDKEGYPPFVIRTQGIDGGTVGVGLDESSQYLSSLLLTGPITRKGLTVEITGQKVVSWPYVGLTLQAMEDFGAKFSVETRTGESWAEEDWRAPGAVAPGMIRFVIPAGSYQGRELRVEGDWSNASYFLAAGAVGPRPVTVCGLRKDSLQGDRAILSILERMGASLSWNADVENELDKSVEDEITVSPRPLRGVDVDMGACPDIVPTVAIVAALASGPTRIRNVAHLRIKESDRLTAVATELQRIGASVEVLEDGLAITPVRDKAALDGKLFDFCSYGDHRIPMSLAVLERLGVAARFDNPHCVAKSFPGFWEAWRPLLPSL